MKANINTYEKLCEGFVRLGIDSLPPDARECEREILKSIDESKGGARIEFIPLNDEKFASLASVFESPTPYGKESYIIEICDTVRIYYTSRITKLYALYALRRMYSKNGVRRGIIYNTPKLDDRIFRVYTPGRDGIEEFLRLIDYLIAFGHNAIMIEIAGAMEYKRHPEINTGWEDYCKIASEFNGKTEWVQRSDWYPKNSFHYENGGCSYITQDEMRRIVDYCRERDFEIIPEVPSLSHADYLLYNHPELAEIPGDRLPNNACPQNEDYYKLIFDVLDEVCEVIKPSRVNICHDEAYVFCYCPRCRGKDASKLFAYHITRLHDYLKEKDIATMIWCDGIMPIEHGGKAAFHRRFPWDGKRLVDIHGEKYEVHNFKYLSLDEYHKLYAEVDELEGLYVPPKYKSGDMIPKDIQTIDWSWSNHDSSDYLNERGFYRLYGNYCAVSMPRFNEELKKKLRGISYSNWGANDFDTLQRTASLFSLSYNWLAAWGGDFDSYAVTENTMIAAREAHKYLNYKTLERKHIRITHNTDSVIDHPYFYDGFLIIKEDYRIGDYEIEYTDGTKDAVGVYWGHNIGQRKVKWNKHDVSSMDDGCAVKYIYEPIGETCPVLIEKDTAYEMLIPTDKEVKSVTPIARDGYNINLIKYEIIE